MKKALVVLAMFGLLMASVMAALPTGFHLDKNVLVTGDWAWDGDSWEQGNFPTASFTMETHSWKATEAFYGEEEKLGQPWKYDLSAVTQTNAKTTFTNSLSAITVNPPTTTPGTAWTYYSYDQMTAGDFTQSSLSVTGYGSVLLNSLSKVKSPAMQMVELEIN